MRNSPTAKATSSPASCSASRHRNVVHRPGQDRSDACLPIEQIPGETYRHGDRIKVYITEVRKTTKGPQVMHLPHPSRLAEAAVRAGSARNSRRHRRDQGGGPRSGQPLQDRGRIPRSRTSTRSAPASAHGARGCRRSSGIEGREDRHRRVVARPGALRGQRPQPGQGRASVSSTETRRSARVVVPDHQLSLAIGKEGQNARLAAKTDRLEDRHQERVADGRAGGAGGPASLR